MNDGVILILVSGLLVSLVIVFLLVGLFGKERFMYFDKMDTSPVVMEEINFPVEGTSLPGVRIVPRWLAGDIGGEGGSLPLVVLIPGWGMRVGGTRTLQWGISLALGCPSIVVAFQPRSMDKRVAAPLFDDFKAVLDQALGMEGVDPGRVGIFGISLGAQVGLARGYPDPRVKAIVALSPPHDSRENFSRKGRGFRERVTLGFLRMLGIDGKKMDEADNLEVSPRYILQEGNDELNRRVFLVHARDDHTISFDEFMKNREKLSLGPGSCLVLERGGHGLLHQELLVLASALRFFHERFGHTGVAGAVGDGRDGQLGG